MKMRHTFTLLPEDNRWTGNLIWQVIPGEGAGYQRLLRLVIEQAGRILFWRGRFCLIWLELVNPATTLLVLSATGRLKAEKGQLLAPIAVLQKSRQQVRWGLPVRKSNRSYRRAFRQNSR